MLEQLSDDLWIYSIPHQFLGLHMGARMTIIRQANQGLILHSPIPLTSDIKSQLDDLGPVEHLIAPNLFHHMYVKEYTETYPKARLHGAQGLQQKRQDLQFHTQLTNQAQSNTKALLWDNTLEHITIEGMPKLQETVFFHKASQTLICCDLLLNVQNTKNWWTKVYLKLSNVDGKIGVSKVIKMVFKNKSQARQSMDRILKWDFQRIIISHGNIISTNGNAILRENYAWLA